jgi:hypothetical protein
MEQLSSRPRRSRIMGRWVLDMPDAAGAIAAIDSLPPALRAAIEVRRTIWDVQVWTDNDAAATWVADHY